MQKLWLKVLGILCLLVLLAGCVHSLHVGPTVFQACVNQCRLSYQECQRICADEENQNTVYVGAGVGGTF